MRKKIKCAKFNKDQNQNLSLYQILMASSKQGTAVVRHLLLVLLFVSSASARSLEKKVSLELYYETLCPYCSRFMVNLLPRVFEDGLISIVDLKLVPYGNARVGPNGTITCQHGPYECILNTIEACVIKTWPNINQHFRFIYCVEKLVVDRNYLEWESCFPKTGLESKAVLDCYNSGYGRQLELQYAEQTDALQPPHRYVPWVVVNGQPLYDDYEKFESYICKAYDGELPKACGGLTMKTNDEINADRAGNVCYADTIISRTTYRKKHSAKIEMLL